MTAPAQVGSRRALVLMVSCALGIALVGFLTGTRTAPEPEGYRPASSASEHAVARAPKHRDMARARYADRAVAQAAALELMGAPPRDPEAELSIDPKRYAADVAARADGRAFDGAPPTIPHAVDQQGVPACLACHGEGLRVPGEARDKIAKPMSHPVYESCLQCHVTRDGPLPTTAPLAPSVAEKSTFAGLASPGHGPRAWPGAPPQMPHRSFMRERCVSCHGVWAEGIASSHPWRQSCQQCHTPAADADQGPRSVLAALPSLEAAP